MDAPRLPEPTAILLDADACPVEDESYRVAARHGLRTYVVANSFMTLPRDPAIERVLVGGGFDAADDWIAARARPGVVVVTADVPLAGRCVAAGAEVVAPNGRPFSAASIGLARATRDLMAELREAGHVTGGPPPFGPRNRSDFLQALESAVRRAKRAAPPA